MKEKESKINLIPDSGPDTGNYWCTWDTQYRLNTVEKGKDTKNLRNILTQEFLFAENGVLNKYFDGVRKDIYVLLDDGWDVPQNTPGNGDISVFGSLILDQEKFSDFCGSPQERLKKIRDKVLKAGYRGLGLWICANAAGECGKAPYSLEKSREYWKERAIWSRNAGIDYWKVDWGYHCMDADYRVMMTEIVKQFAPDLKIEHAYCQGPVNKEIEDEDYFSRVLSSSDFFRTYDVIREFNYSTALERAWNLLKLCISPNYGCKGIVNVEDAPYLAAGLGCSMGIMRHPIWGGSETDVLNFGLSYNEVARALRWQRIAPPFGVSRTRNCRQGELTDWTESFDGPDAEGWLADIKAPGERLIQKAPQMIARNMEFPVLKTKEEAPFLVCSKHPDTGAVSIAFLPRTVGKNKLYTPAADVEMKIASLNKPLGILGGFKTISVTLEEELSGRIYLQDLCREEAVDVTEIIVKNKKELLLDYARIKNLGCLENDAGDPSEPGFMVCQL